MPCDNICRKSTLRLFIIASSWPEGQRQKAMEIDVEGLAQLLLQKGGSPGELCTGPQAVKWFCNSTVKAFGPGRCDTLYVFFQYAVHCLLSSSVNPLFAGKGMGFFVSLKTRGGRGGRVRGGRVCVFPSVFAGSTYPTRQGVSVSSARMAIMFPCAKRMWPPMLKSTDTIPH